MALVTRNFHKLRALFDGREHVLGRSRTILGGDRGCEIQVAGAEVAARHTMIVALLDSAYLEDLGSVVGTYLNGRRIAARTRLANGDCIGLGCHEFHYQCEPLASEPADNLASLATDAGTYGRLQPRWGLKFGRLTVLTGPARGRGFDITKPHVTVGRARGEIATIRRDACGFVFSLRTPVGAAGHPPVVNGRNAGGAKCLLHDGDVIEMAGVQIEFVEIF
ncbi:MAG: FHA domain-containing protein [Gammaproteobacteria bacterium]|nr:FHA domain-containing protein [Gammaproteobacteria bacterium]